MMLGGLSLTGAQAQQRSVRGLVSFGQSAGLAGDTLFLDIDKDIAVQLLPFDELVKIATNYSPLLKYYNEVSNALSAATDVTKTQILQNVSGYATYSNGNQAILSTGGTTADTRGNQIANGYRVGVDVRLPIYEVFGRKHLIRQATANHKASLIQRDIAILDLKRQLIGIYQDMITAQQVLKTRLLDEQASLAAYRIAEVELQRGRGTAELLAGATNRYVETKSVSEQVKGEFLKNVHYFETLMGVPIQRLKRVN